MFALIFLAMWAHTNAVAPLPIVRMDDLNACRKLGTILELQAPERYASHPDGQPTAIHWWCVETDTRGGVV